MDKEITITINVSDANVPSTCYRTKTINLYYVILENTMIDPDAFAGAIAKSIDINTTQIIREELRRRLTL